MRQTIKALGWLIRILWVITLIVPITIAFSLTKLMEGNNIGVGESSLGFSNGMFTMTTPFFINNTGFYDLSNLNLTIIVRSNNQTLARFSETFPVVPAHQKLESNYTISFSLQEILSKATLLLTNDTELDLEVAASFRVAYAIALGVSADFTTLWGAPFYNLTISDVTYNPLSQKFSVPISFENHAYFPLKGTLRAELYNNRGELIVDPVSQYLNVSTKTQFQTSIELRVNDLAKITSSGVLRLYFDDEQVLEMEWG